MDRSINPLRADAPAEIPLANAPLVRVIGQVRFPLIAKINKEAFIADFQQEIRGMFPVLRSEKQKRVRLTPEGPVEEAPSVIWRFTTEDQHWRASLAPDFVALETTNYSSRSDFISKLKAIFVAAEKTVGLSMVDRIGLRYIDRIEITESKEVLELVHPELTGLIGSALVNDAELAMQETILTLPENDGRLKARWGLVPRNATVDPSAIEPIDKPTWIMDLDVFSTPNKKYTQDELATQFEKFAQRSYSIFRWAITDQFIEKFGGQV